MFYLKRKAFDSAIIYFKDVIANFPNAHRAPDALLRLGDTYRAIHYTQELQETCDHLRRLFSHAAGPAGRRPAAGGTTPTASPASRTRRSGGPSAPPHPPLLSWATERQ